MTSEPGNAGLWLPDGPLDVDEPAHLDAPAGSASAAPNCAVGHALSVRRYSPRPVLADFVRRFWVPVWSLPPGQSSVQRVLQYPVCQLVFGEDGCLLVGPHSGLNTEELRGRGWAVGVMLQPAAGQTLVGGPVSELTNARRPLGQPGFSELATSVRRTMGNDPASVPRQHRACAEVSAALAALLPVDEEGLLANAIVEYVEGDREVHRVTQVCAKFDIGERSLQRLLSRRVGLTPKWLIQRRRLHDAAALLGAEAVDLARLAADLGYADQAHFTRDFRTVTGLTPGQFAAEVRR